jgi:hypothetical protein
VITTIVAEARWKLRECASVLEEQSVALKEAGYHVIPAELLKASERVAELRGAIDETMSSR